MRRVAIAVLAAVLVSSVALAEIPQVVGYQGRITDNSGVPVADGTYTMRFRIYTAATGGALLWDSNSQSVTLADGIFNVMLGESPQPAISSGPSPCRDFPESRISPEWARRIPEMALRTVLLPAPFAPTRATMALSGTWKETSQTAWASP